VTLGIRPGRPEDRDAVWPLARDFATTFQVERPAFDVAFAALLADDRTWLLVAHEDDVVLGYVLASWHQTFLANGPVCWVEELMVSEEYRSKGVGRTLMRAVEAKAERLGCAYVSLASRRAVGFYTGIGYEDSAAFLRKLI
jgi:GNAT superfamily N-acetyltransferase